MLGSRGAVKLLRGNSMYWKKFFYDKKNYRKLNILEKKKS